MQCAICGEELADAVAGCPLCDEPTARPEPPVEICLESPDRLSPGSVLAGRYRLVRRLGRGGMGEVYLADDLRLGEPVALKLLSPAWEQDPVMRARFLAEVRFARQVSHPNVCRVYDVGEAGGRLFLTMEHVDGEDLRTLLERFGRLPREQAVDLAVKICQGLAAIHAEGILHRDLKPANVMIDSDGHVRLTDFGLAALADSAETARAAVRGAAPESSGGTPAYMAPEQLRGEPADVASDLYALGLVIYELITGRRAHSGRAAVELARLYRTADPAAPPAPELDAGELDPAARRVVRWCLAGQPHERPASAEAVGAMLEGFLEAEREAERVARRRAEHVRRQRRILAVAIAVLLVFGAITNAMAWRMANEARRAEREAQAARQVADFLAGMFAVSGPYEPPRTGLPHGHTVTARELVDLGAERLRSELQDQPEIRARLLNTVGRVYSQLALYDSAEELFEQALALRKESLGNEHPDTAESRLDLARVRRAKGDLAGAAALLDEALSLRRKNHGGESPVVAGLLNELAWVEQSRGEAERAEELALEALAMTRRLTGGEHSSVAANLELLAFLRQLRGDLAGAEAYAREALAMTRRLSGDEHAATAEGVHTLARVLLAKEDFEGAEALFRESLALRRRLLGDEHYSVAQSLHDLACVLLEKEDYEGAEPLFRESLALYRRLVGDEHAGVTMNLKDMVVLYEAWGRTEKADEHRALLEAVSARDRQAEPALRDNGDVAEELG